MELNCNGVAMPLPDTVGKQKSKVSSRLPYLELLACEVS